MNEVENPTVTITFHISTPCDLMPMKNGEVVLIYQNILYYDKNDDPVLDERKIIRPFDVTGEISLVVEKGSKFTYWIRSFDYVDIHGNEFANESKIIPIEFYGVDGEVTFVAKNQFGLKDGIHGRLILTKLTKLEEFEFDEFHEEVQALDSKTNEWEAYIKTCGIYYLVIDCPGFSLYEEHRYLKAGEVYPINLELIIGIKFLLFVEEEVRQLLITEDGKLITNEHEEAYLITESGDQLITSEIGEKLVSETPQEYLSTEDGKLISSEIRKSNLFVSEGSRIPKAFLTSERDPIKKLIPLENSQASRSDFIIRLLNKDSSKGIINIHGELNQTEFKGLEPGSSWIAHISYGNRSIEVDIQNLKDYREVQVTLT